MIHDSAMHAMVASTLVLLAVPMAFVVVGVLWYRQSLHAHARLMEEEAARYVRDGVEAR